MMPNVHFSSIQIAGFLNPQENSRQDGADSLSPDCKLKTSFWPVSVTPMAARTGTLSMLRSRRILKWTPSIKRYLTGSCDKSLLAPFEDSLRQLHIDAAESESEKSSGQSILRKAWRASGADTGKNSMPNPRPISASYCLFFWNHRGLELASPITGNFDLDLSYILQCERTIIGTIAMLFVADKLEHRPLVP